MKGVQRPRPWRIREGDEIAIEDANGDLVESLTVEDEVELARFIIKTVNAHNDLLKACQVSEGVLFAMVEGKPMDVHAPALALVAVRAALQKALA